MSSTVRTPAGAPSRRRYTKPFVALAVVVGLALSVGACTKEDVARYAIREKFGPSLSDTAIKIATCESGLQADAVSPDGNNIGLFQINRVHEDWIKSDLGYDWEQLKDPFVNSEVAKVLYDRAGGWSPWHGTCGGSLGI